MSTLVLAEVPAAATLRRWLGARARVVDETTRSHSELGCVRFTTEDGTQISVLEDHVGEVAYATVEGPAAVTWSESLTHVIQCVGVAGVLAMLGANADPRQWIRGLSRLALLRDDRLRSDATDAMSEAMLQAWTRALAHPHSAVRRAAIRTCHGARSSSLRAIVVARVGVDLELRPQLERLVAHLDRLGGALPPSAG
jgi:hypothetical protein